MGKSRNTNTSSYYSKTTYTPRTAGWRVWNIDNSTGEVTLISAGHTETYYFYNQSSTSVNILKNRNCTMYENEYAKTGSAHILTGEEVVTWYNAIFGTNYTLDKQEMSTMTGAKFSTNEPISVLENGSFYWLATASTSTLMYHVDPTNRFVLDGRISALGVRILLTLKPDIQLDLSAGDGSESNPWKLAQ